MTQSKTRSLLLALSFLLLSPAFAQQSETDSLKQVLNRQSEDSAKVRTLNRLSYALLKEGAFEASHYAEEAETLAEKIDDRHGLAQSYALMGMICSDRGEDANALNYYMKSLQIDEALGDQQKMFLRYLDIGNVYSEMGNGTTGLNYYRKAAALGNSFKDQSKLGIVYLNMATAYSSINETENALSYASKAKEIAVTSGNKNAEAHADETIGLCYFKTGKETEALTAFNESYTLYSEISDRRGMTALAYNIGNVYTQRNTAEALSWHQKAALSAREAGLTKELCEVYEALAKDYKHTGNYQQALNYYEQFQQLNDSLSQQEHSRQLAEMEIKVETEKKEAELAKLKDEAGKMRLSSPEGNFTLLVVFIGISILLFIVLMIYIIISQNKLNNLRYQLSVNQQMYFNTKTRTPNPYDNPGNTGGTNF